MKRLNMKRRFTLKLMAAVLVLTSAMIAAGQVPSVETRG
jgi:hypothetical protein